LYKKYSKECLWCGKLFETNRQDKLCCNHVCSSKRNKEVSKSWYEKERVRWIKKPPAFFTNATDKIKEIKRRYQVYQHSAKRRRRRFNLTIEEFKGFIIGECCYCGAQANSFNGIDTFCPSPLLVVRVFALSLLIQLTFPFMPFPDGLTLNFGTSTLYNISLKFS